MITIIDSIRAIPKNQWDVMAGDNALASHGWLLTVEETFLRKVKPLYFLYNKNGRLSGAAVCYLIPINVKMFSPDNLLFGRLKKFINSMGVSFLPAMVCGPIKAYGKHIFLKKDINLFEAEQITQKILNAVEQEAQKRKLPLSFPHILEHEKVLIKQLNKRGYIQTIDLPLSYMDISWHSFDAYKKNIGKRSLNIRKSISREISKNRKSGVTIEVTTDFNGDEDRLYRLLNENHIKYNSTPLPFRKDFLSRLKRNLGENLVIYRSIKKGRVSGMVVMLIAGDTGFLSFVGIDHFLVQNDATYFNISFYQPITDAISKNRKRLYFGNAMYNMKIRRGCKIQKAFFFHKPFHWILKPPIILLFSFHRFWYQKKLP